MKRCAIFVFFCVLLLPMTTHAFSQTAIARAVATFFPEEPAMVDIARCESGLQQYTPSGRVLRGGYGNMMIGLFQLHEKYHRAPAARMGYNIDTLLGNIMYTRTLYRTEGTTPWRSSAHCWEKANTSTVTKEASIHLSSTLRYGMRGREVAVLQDILDELGYFTRTFTPSRFDSATYLALASFQCDEGIACLKDPDNRVGIGTTNAKTRKALNAYAVD